MKTEAPTVCEEPWRENKSFQLLAIKNRQKSLPESTKRITKGNRLLSPAVWGAWGWGGNSNSQVLLFVYKAKKISEEMTSRVSDKC